MGRTAILPIQKQRKGSKDCNLGSWGGMAEGGGWAWGGAGLLTAGGREDARSFTGVQAYAHAPTTGNETGWDLDRFWYSCLQPSSCYS